MIQLQYDTGSNFDRAFWSNQYYTGSILLLTVTSSFVGNYDTIAAAVVQNNTTEDGNNGWIVFNISGSQIPTQSGHYTVDIYNRLSGSPEIWETADDVWNTISEAWEDYGTAERSGVYLGTERVFVTGSDYDEQYKYQNNELAYYNVYNG